MTSIQPNLALLSLALLSPSLFKLFRSDGQWSVSNKLRLKPASYAEEIFGEEIKNQQIVHERFKKNMV